MCRNCHMACSPYGGVMRKLWLKGTPRFSADPEWPECISVGNRSVHALCSHHVDVGHYNGTA